MSACGNCTDNAALILQADNSHGWPMTPTSDNNTEYVPVNMQIFPCGLCSNKLSGKLFVTSDLAEAFKATNKIPCEAAAAFSLFCRMRMKNFRGPGAEGNSVPCAEFEISAAAAASRFIRWWLRDAGGTCSRTGKLGRERSTVKGQVVLISGYK